MATVIKTADGVYQATLTDKETRALARLAQEAPAVPSAKKMETWMTAWLAGAVKDFLNTDSSARLANFSTLPLDKQDAVDALLNGG